ncbi:Scarecrow-like protein 18 [Apostasia shenzhenica]|uniref:Scarecrow-like protein 18 n=1 Tax=Apostasia shenzhenica TaxID=1088818 RepID=A0A2I0A4N2_9ASPA|nr:Scarecrow-like protein 18 [Apostasia shenzhenica]
MLTSFKSHEELHHHLLRPPPHEPAPRPGHHHRLLLHCAELIHSSDFSAARRAVSLLLAASSASGDSADRLNHYFSRALALRLRRLSGLLPPPSPPPPHLASQYFSTQSSHLFFNQLAPFLRFAHLTANQAILESISGHRSIHIVDFDVGHGLQWPPLLQSLADRSDPPAVRITGTGSEPEILFHTCRRLQSFADSLSLKFNFHPLCLPPTASFSFQSEPDELLAVNCILFLHKLPELRRFLRAVKGMNPSVVTVAEREGRRGSPVFLERFAEALTYYSALFESLEATLPPASRERRVVEELVLGREIEGIVAGSEEEGSGETAERWEEEMGASGFVKLPLSAFAVAQAKLLLRLHYPSEGYLLETTKGSIFLGWRNKPLFSVSSWRC